MRNYKIFPCYIQKLFFKNKNGKRNIIYFTKNAKLLCFKNGDIGIKSKNIAINLFNVDKLLKIEYIRNEKSWVKYHGRQFLHYFSGSEKVLCYKDNPDFVRIKSSSRLWGYQKIKDEEVK